jgi:hypothetical protein
MMERLRPALSIGKVAFYPNVAAVDDTNFLGRSTSLLMTTIKLMLFGHAWEMDGEKPPTSEILQSGQ